MVGEETIIEKAREENTPYESLQIFMIFLDLTVAPSECRRTQESLYISEKATSDMEWQGGHRSLSLIVPVGRHPGQHWDCFT